MQRLKFGYTGQVGPPAWRSVDAMRRAEAQGWDTIRFPDQMAPTHPYGMVPLDVAPTEDPRALICSYGQQWFGSFEMMSAAAMVTNTIGLLGAVIDPLRRSPSVFAQECVTVDHLSSGRATWAIASGEAKQFEAFGEKRVKPLARTIDAVRTMYALWQSNGRPVSRESEFTPLTDAVFPLPLYNGKTPDMLVVGANEDILKLAGELCDGWLTWAPGGVENNPAELADRVTAVKAAATATGRDPDSLRIHLNLVVAMAENDEIAWEYARRPPMAFQSLWGASFYTSESWKKLGFEHPLGDAAWPRTGRVVDAMTPEEVENLPNLIPEEITKHTILWGTPERIAERIQPFIDTGVTEISFNNSIPWTQQDEGPKWPALASKLITLLGGEPLNLDA